MIAALFALAAAMIIAGVTAVIEGFPYVRLESGMAMVYGGSVVGSSGVLLFGLAVVATGLRRVEKTLRQGRGSDDAVLPAPVREAGNADIDPFQDFVPPPVTAGPGATADRTRIEPSLSETALAAPDAGPRSPRQPEVPAAIEPELPLPGLTPPHAADKPATEVRTETGDDLFVPPRPTPEPVAAGPAHTETALRSSLYEAPAAGPERTVVGRYSSGGNTYMMFDDGAIEADTPNGRFTFASLDELKAFVDGGGEAGARGAA